MERERATITSVAKSLLGNRIMLLRKLNGVKQEQLRAACGYRSKGTISRIEKGHIGMTDDKLVLAARVLNVHPFVLQTPVDLSMEQLQLLSKFMDILSEPEKNENYNAIKLLIEK